MRVTRPPEKVTYSREKMTFSDEKVVFTILKVTFSAVLALGAGIRQASRLTGVSFGVIQKIAK